MALYKKVNDKAGNLIGYVMTVGTVETSFSSTRDSRELRKYNQWIIDGGVPDEVDAYAPSLAQARLKRIAEIKRQAKKLYREHTDQYSNQYAMQTALGQTPTAISANIQTYYGDMKTAFINAKNSINAETDMITIATFEASFPTPP